MTAIAVLASGRGSNLQALIAAAQDGRIEGQLACVISDRPCAGALEHARDAGIEARIIEHGDEAQLQAALDACGAQWICLAGYMRILSPQLVAAYTGRILNIHPSLLPRHRGLRTHQRALEAGDREHGCSVHFATAELDAGPVIIQARVPVLPDDTAATLAQRVLEQEHRIYPLAVQWLCAGLLQLADGAVRLHGQPLAEPVRYETL